MTENLRTVEAIILEAFELSDLTYDSDLLPPDMLVNYIDNIGVCLRDYPQLYQRAVPYLNHLVL